MKPSECNRNHGSVFNHLSNKPYASSSSNTVALGFCRKSGLLGFGQMNLVVHMFHMFDSGRVGVTLRRQKLTWRSEDFWRGD
ncbi:hypothetical protein HanRHA438_Chr13g0607631 [Helianthus annuus]|uniref:Uncharacterized protein n=1 Tax=Helianthus annuus TaxID=4232 RepID=A0A251STV1_HELAN|nr:hypothetical protein HanHA300_Chr13g0489731 [Helianthus annuus]KAJ0482036.1 hypothetical protein HanIR_Chr13g0649431 [Helianthus annuus]KAJ0498373.1 hypothetical protein HanHA89_Chr13g0521871 [Helianthus annuus]KAJ0664383.1 hypothetical protein HanLR1_Chr13g0491801 [Helianthus annuus]KAJ0671844.1 hypothetical protein HanOQP8_Chr13g0490271 [Helianthus annuus]